LRKKDGKLDFNQPAISLRNQVRAFNPWPGAYTSWKDQMLKIHNARVVMLDETDSSFLPGKHIIVREPGKSHELPAIYTARDLLVLCEVQPAGKNSMPGEAFLQGARDWA